MEANVNTGPAPQQMVLPRQVHLSDYLAIIGRRKWVVIITFLLIVCGVTLFSLRTTPVYRASGQIIIEKQPSVNDPMGENAYRGQAQGDYYQTQYNLLYSRNLALKVIKEIDLPQLLRVDTEVRPESALSLQIKGLKQRLASYVSRGVALIRGDRRKPAAPATMKPDNEDPTPVDPGMLGWVDWYLASLGISPVRGSGLVNISFQSTSPELATRIANAHMHVAIENSIQMQRAAANKALAWLKTQLEEQKEKVEGSQRTIHQYKASNNILSLDKNENAVSQELDDLNAALTRAKTERMAKEAVYNQLRNFSKKDNSLFFLPEVAKDPIILNLRGQLVGLQAKKIEMGTNYGPKHPGMIELNSGMRQLKQVLLEEVNRVKRSVKADMDRAAAREISLKKTLDIQKSAAMILDQKAVSYSVLELQAESNQQIYDLLLKQSNEIGLAAVLESSNIRIVDRANLPRFPVKPRIFLNIMLAVVLGLFLGTGLAFFFEYMDNTIKTPDDVPQRLGIPALGVLPYDKSFKGDKALALLPEGGLGSDTVGSCALMDISCRFTTGLPLGGPGVSGRVLMVESATSGEGKTTVLVNMGSSLAAAGLRVLMVDCDFQRPRLHEVFGSANGSGLTKAFSRVLHQETDKGKLEEMSVADLFFLISLRKQSGKLTILNDDRIMSVHFQDGRFIHIQNKDNPPGNRLGTMLLRGGFITEGQLEEALDRNKRTGQPIGYILINAGYLTRDQLQGPTRLQTEENLQKLFSWKTGTFELKPGPVEIYESERISFSEDYSGIIDRLGRLGGSRLLENELFSHVKKAPGQGPYILPAGNGQTSQAGPLNLALLTRFMEILKPRFDVILVDVPPLDALAGAPALSTMVDGVILVVKAGHLSGKTLSNAMETIRDTNIIGAILNQAKLNRNAYYYR